LLAGGIKMPQRMQDPGMDGRLPSMAPLANPYVPFQLENPPMYEAKKGVVRGTLFPGLDLPFMGMENKTEKNKKTYENESLPKDVGSSGGNVCHSGMW
jgi:hypothetical protein